MADSVLLGWLAVLAACAFFGSFAVPIKHPSVIAIKADPVVFQTFKTAMVLLTALPLAIFVDFNFVWWGIISGLFWVPASIAIIISVPRIGVAAAQGICNSLIVIVSFVWGVGVFGEQISMEWLASLCVVALVCGVVGMTYYSRSPVIQSAQSSSSLSTPITSLLDPSNHDRNPNHLVVVAADVLIKPTPATAASCVESPLLVHVLPIHSSSPSFASRWFGSHDKMIGYAGAVFNGLYGGSVMAPLKFAQRSDSNVSGLQYVLSFAVGSAIVNSVILFVYCVYRRCERLPPQHQPLSQVEDTTKPPVAVTMMSWAQIASLAPYACVAGFLWSMGNVSSIFAVLLLGQAVGYSSVQANVVVSGLWGIFYYHEIQGSRVLLWIGFACVAVGSIAGLSILHE